MLGLGSGLGLGLGLGWGWGEEGFTRKAKPGWYLVCLILALFGRFLHFLSNHPVQPDTQTVLERTIDIDLPTSTERDKLVSALGLGLGLGGWNKG